MKKVVIIGGGASGIFCAIAIKMNSKEEVSVTILEAQNRIGKKILVTGNGKCNLTNLDINESHYNTDLVHWAIDTFDPQTCVKYFEGLGLMTRVDEAGRVYPYSEKATTVLDVLMRELERLDIQVITEYEVSHIKKTDLFLVYSKDYRVLNFDYLVMATGGVANINFENAGYKILSDLGHSLTDLSPGLVALKTKENLKPLSGIRVKAKATIINNNQVLASTVGEILFKENGLSGIAIFELSRFHVKGCKVVLDLAYDKSESEIQTFLSKNSNLEDGLNGMFPKMISQDILKRNGKKVVEVIKNYEFNVIDTYGFNNAQITVGGINNKEVNPFTYESFIIKDLYVIGEVLDVDGTCGGYNLHFAWASGYLAALDISKKISYKGDKRGN
jgi:predicted Rossmann fold flavoprotein